MPSYETTGLGRYAVKRILLFLVTVFSFVFSFPVAAQDEKKSADGPAASTGRWLIQAPVVTEGDSWKYCREKRDPYSKQLLESIEYEYVVSNVADGKITVAFRNTRSGTTGTIKFSPNWDILEESYSTGFKRAYSYQKDSVLAFPLAEKKTWRVSYEYSDRIRSASVDLRARVGETLEDVTVGGKTYRAVKVTMTGHTMVSNVSGNFNSQTTQEIWYSEDTKRPVKTFYEAFQEIYITTLSPCEKQK